MPRPRKDDPRDSPFPIRLSVAERALLQRRAKAKGSPTLAAYVRSCLFENAATAAVAPSLRVTAPVQEPAARGRFGLLGPRVAVAPEPAPIQPESVVADDQAMQLFHELRRIGVNVNQIAHRLNDFREVAPEELSATLAELRACLAQVRPAAS